jgi:carbon storage regulator CsrA
LLSLAARDRPAILFIEEQMLVLTRKAAESIVIGDVTVYIGDIRRGRVRIAVDAPDDVPIVRGELLSDDADLTEKPSEWVLAAR